MLLKRNKARNIMTQSVNFSYKRAVIDTLKNPETFMATAFCISSLVYPLFKFSNQTLNTMFGQAYSWVIIITLSSSLFKNMHATTQGCSKHKNPQVCATHFMSDNKYKSVMVLFLQLFATCILSYDILNALKIFNLQLHPIPKICAQVIMSGLLASSARSAILQAKRGFNAENHFIHLQKQKQHVQDYQATFVRNHIYEQYKQITMMFYFIFSATTTFTKMIGFDCKYYALCWSPYMETVLSILVCMQNLHKKIRFTERMNQIQKQLNVKITCHTLNLPQIS